jgi:uncharacterized protein (TIGR03084 family)
LVLDALLSDLMAETGTLGALLLNLDPNGWDVATPAPGWTVRDQVTHLAFFDEAQRHALVDPKGFEAMRQEVLADVDGYTDRVAKRHRHLSGSQVLAWFHRARSELVNEIKGRDPRERVPWFGPDMSLSSAVTARIMETWAHGQDVFDAVGAKRRPTERLRHIAFLGHRALANSFTSHGLPAPESDVRVELEAPSGDTWAFGPEDAPDIVWGTAEDFCLVVTQRRHVSDTTLTAVGVVATKWLTIAQAFAGPPGSGRRPGQFPM